MPRKATENPAYQALLSLANRRDLQISDAGNWRMGDLDQTKVKDAAVLILFGVLDQQPAQETGLPTPVGSDLDVLIVVRAGSLRHHAGQPAFPGGKVDPEDYQEAEKLGLPVAQVAALREAVEETGLDPAGVQILGSLEPLPLAVSNFRVTPVLAWWTSTSPVTAQNAQESSQVVRVAVADLLNPANRHRAQAKHGRRIHNSPAFQVKSPEGDFVIWGFTGILLDKIFTELGWSLPWDKKDKRPAPGYETS